MPSLSRAAALALLFASTAAIAQRTDDNATREADDAFGKSVGDERIGIYQPMDVRGFSAVEAGNVRIDGLYFDQQADPSGRLIESTTVRVGVSAQGYPFPAPTGIADHSLRKPGADAIASVALRYGPFDAKAAELDVQLPILGETLGFAGGVALYHDNQHFGGTPRYLSMAAIPVWRPAEGVEVIPFWSSIQTSSEEAQTLVFTGGDYLPPKVKRNRLIGQPWAEFNGTNWNTGLIVKAPVAGFDVALGAFRSIDEADSQVLDILTDVQPDGAANRLVIADEDNRFASTSGELRVGRSLDEGPRRHQLIGMVRARDQKRRYGGSDAVSLGPTIYGTQDFRPEPDLAFGPKTRDRVKQTTFGLGYHLRWRDVGEFGLGVQKTDYSKKVTDPDPSVMLPVSRSSPWLWNATAAVNITDGLAIYGGYTRGLEESPVASELAVNRNEAPPAIRTEQKDAGVRWAITPQLSAIAGVFDISKPYFNLDGANRFRKLGELRHRGVELSLAGQILPNLNIVAGTRFLDAEVTGEEVDAGLIGDKPIGAIERYSILSIDYRFPNTGLSIDAFAEETGDRIANAANTLVIPPRAVLALGGRYRFKVNGANVLVRGQVGNIFNNYGFGVGGSGFFVYNLPRRYSLTVAADI